LLRQFPQYLGVTENDLPAGYNVYHALQLRLQKRLSSGVTGTAFYTFSKLISNANNLTTGFLDTGNPAYQYDLNLKNERSLAPSDVAHRFVFDAVWELPFGRGHALGRTASAWMNHLIGGWQLNGILTLQSGFPLNLGVSGAPPYAGSRPSRVPGQSAATSGSIVDRLGGVSSATPYINPNAFRLAQSFEFGDAPRLMPDLRGPGIRNVDFSLFKNFMLREQARIQLRAEAFNASNTPRFANPATTFNTPSIWGDRQSTEYRPTNSSGR
jgi:hypothetical protein